MFQPLYAEQNGIDNLAKLSNRIHNLPTSSRIKQTILLNGDQTGMVAENQTERFQHHFS